MNRYLCYVSTRAAYDPVKTIFVCAPGPDAASVEAAERFARVSGWREAAEADGAVLILPVVPEGWRAAPVSLLSSLYEELRGSIASRNGRSLLGRNGKLWLWETMLYAVGYEDGAEFAGNCVVAEPNRFAASALIGGAPGDYAVRPVTPWFVPASARARRSDQIPSSLWLLNPGDSARALSYFRAVNGLSDTPVRLRLGALEAVSYENPQNPAQRLLLSDAPLPSGLSLAHAILSEYFDRTVRWKDGPDGTLRLHLGRADFYESPKFVHESISFGGLDYPCALHFPANRKRNQSLPLLLSLHGRGEPARLFAEKNGWDALADETGAFVLAVPDSPGNIWLYERDGAALAALIARLVKTYDLDATRVYLTGFSNGGAMTRELGTAHPELFAAIAPFNAPAHIPGLTFETPFSPDFPASGFELPCWAYAGDSDKAAAPSARDEQLPVLLAANGCAAPPELWTVENHYAALPQGERFQSEVYRAPDGGPRVGWTVMRDMPHGAIWEESRVAWEFLRHFHRPAGAKRVVYTP